MISKKVLRYYASCGRGYWSKKAAINHEENCKCWKNPKFKTCLSCKFKNFVRDSDGVQTWTNNDCTNPKFDFDKMFRPVHEHAEHIAMMCPVWESKVMVTTKL